MRKRRIVVGLALTALLLAGGALPAQAVLGVPNPPTPTAGQLQTLVQSLVPATPTVVPPSVDPQKPMLPSLPYVAVPTGLNPALGVLSPTTVVTCQVSYLGPLGAIVALSAAFDATGVDPPVQPSFLNPLFGPVTTACVLAPFPTVTSCGPDGTITEQLAGLPPLPAAGPLPTVDPFSSVPAPFASVVVAIKAIEASVSHYAYNDTWTPKVSQRVAKQLTCQ